MPTDPYAPCPGGTGKKLKFCCSDLLGELEKIERMLEGEQRAACLEYIDGLQAKFPDRACLLSAKAMLETQLGYDERAEATLATFRQKHPDNPVALAEESTVVAEKAGGAAAVARLQDALERCGHEIPAPVYEALGIVAQTLLAETELIAARAHFVLQTAMGGGKDERPIEALSQLNSLPSVPLLAKQDLPLVKAPDDALWKSSFTTAMEPTRRGAWRLAAGQLEQLAARVGDWPPIWHNIAVLRTWLADHPGAVAAWRKYGSQQIPLDDAVEAEAMVQLLDKDSVDYTEMVVLTYAVQDAEGLLARLSASPRTPQLAIDLARMAESGEPPPKGAYLVLDRSIPASGLDIQLADAPRVMGHAFMFGKQTDRPARLEVSAYRPELDEIRAIIAEVCGNSLGAPGTEE
ncbi:MAG TPA: hypothetical protein VHV08_05340, partial [Pirellulales bacterium]|nr:hypothetical protein [Pirellulales bacterium]